MSTAWCARQDLPAGHLALAVLAASWRAEKRLFYVPPNQIGLKPGNAANETSSLS